MQKTQREAKKREEGKVYPTNTSGDIVITKYVNFREVHIEFIETGHRKTTVMPYIRKGSVSDDSIVTVYGVGIFEKGKHPGHIGKTVTPAYRSWSKMLCRCYSTRSDKYKRYGGRGVYVCDEWHNYQNFAEWFNPRYREGYELDKDILKQGNKVYSPETCCLVPTEINQIVIYKAKTLNLPTGVEKKKNKFATAIYKNKVKKRLGSYNTPEEAFSVYKDTKEKYIQEVANEYYGNGSITKDVYDALMNWQIDPYPDRSNRSNTHPKKT